MDSEQKFKVSARLTADVLSATVDGALVASKMAALRKIGVPYSDEEIAAATAAVAGKTEMDAMIAYLQGLGIASQGWK